MPSKKQILYVQLLVFSSSTASIIMGLLCLFLLNITVIIPYLFFGYALASFINLRLFYWHKNLDVSYLTIAFLIFAGCYSIAFYSGGINSPMLYILPSITIAGYIMRRNYGRYSTVVIALTVVIMYLLDNYIGCTRDLIPAESKSFFNLMVITISLVMLGGILGDFMAKSNYQVYKAKKQIESQNQEKELLLKEIHHRVKNNLQIVMSLLKLKGYLVKDKETLEIFDETRSRIYSMVLTHELLYRGDDLANVSYDDYIDNLISNLVDTLSLDKSKVSTEVSVTAVKINLDTAIPLGLLINEVITNALKYGKDENGFTHIFLRLSVKGRQHFSLEIGDTGKGIDEEITAENSESLGLQLIQTLTEQLDGEVERFSDNGTKYIIRFKAQ